MVEKFLNGDCMMMTSKSSRIDLVDALRGFALFGIVLLHHVEHFDIANVVASLHPAWAHIDKSVWDTVFFVFAGKCYPVFALMFGFSFFIQSTHRKDQDRSFAARFFWRMCLLFIWGLFHVMFYSGEILSCYAIVGILVIPLRNLNNKILAVLMVIAMLEPWELYRLACGIIHPEYAVGDYPVQYYLNAVDAATKSDSLWEVIKTNVTSGLTNAHLFSWRSGRYFQTLSLFIAGILLGRAGLFAGERKPVKFWRIVWLLGILCFIPLYALKVSPVITGLRDNLSSPLGVLLNMWSNLAFTAFLVASFILLWFMTNVKRIEQRLIPYGKMSLTNYISSSIIGSFLYYKWGLGLYAYAGPLVSLLMGVITFISLLFFSKWWLSRYKRGPLEWLWYKLTWMKI